ncbi:cytochrome c biogenesis CcdA family protein [uncultured Tessaracoccus sp.]|uniref:cytochrome c biogenesis CcdA family protein n=1 Tax=uncultured Tessaracoccus sp. TaxID=905023 RepID=UPI0025F9B295|nr:cytochrome c biogenesis protein CcdA [uncultured Tessaracoccus sp.]
MTVGFAAAFLGGVAALFSPCSAMLLPSFFALAFGARVATLLGRVALFHLGLLLTLVPLGLGAGTAGALLATHRQTIALVGGVLLVVIGVLTMLGVSIPVPGLAARGGTSPAAVVALGAVYGLAGACTGPLLGAVLTVAALQGSPLYGAILLTLFAAGMTVPLAVLALLWDWARVGERLRPREVRVGPVRTSVWGIVAGGLFVVLGALFLLTDATGALGGLLGAADQAGLEQTLGRWSARVPDLVVLLLVAVVVGALAWWGTTRRDRAPDGVDD